MLLHYVYYIPEASLLSSQAHYLEHPALRYLNKLLLILSSKSSGLQISLPPKDHPGLPNLMWLYLIPLQDYSVAQSIYHYLKLPFY